MQRVMQAKAVPKNCPFLDFAGLLLFCILFVLWLLNQLYNYPRLPFTFHLFLPLHG